jgi:hypothetical protein
MQLKIRIVNKILLLRICNFLSLCQCFLTGVCHCAVTHLYWLWNSVSFVCVCVCVCACACVCVVTFLLQCIFSHKSYTVTKITTVLFSFSKIFCMFSLYLISAFCYLMWWHYFMALDTCVSSIFLVASFVLLFRAYCNWHHLYSILGFSDEESLNIGPVADRN